MTGSQQSAPARPFRLRPQTRPSLGAVELNAPGRDLCGPNAGGGGVGGRELIRAALLLPCPSVSLRPASPQHLSRSLKPSPGLESPLPFCSVVG